MRNIKQTSLPLEQFFPFLLTRRSGKMEELRHKRCRFAALNAFTLHLVRLLTLRPSPALSSALQFAQDQRSGGSPLRSIAHRQSAA
jgi:hypothetical protein